MIIIDWYKEVVLKKFADFTGRAGRAEFWYFVLGNIIIGIVLGLIKFGGVAWLSMLYSLAVLVPGIAVSVRRMHDLGKSGWYLLIALIPLVGAIIVLIWYIQEGQPQENAYGPVPSDTPEETSGNTTPPSDNTTPPSSDNTTPPAAE